MGSDELCPVCGDLVAFESEFSWDELCQKVADGCISCSLLRDGVSHFIENVDVVEKLHLVLDMSLFVYVERTGRQTDVYEFYTLPDHPVRWSKLGPARNVSKNSSSEECIDLARRWLNGCLSSHSACRRTGIPQLPSRVIEVGSCDEETKLFVNTSQKKAEYAALSHCWGSSHPITLTKAKLETMRQKIVFDDSSKTFREAVDVTRRLGIPYLWIDSLCILQDEDDRSDWKSEAPKMSSVYNSATITISAASSIDTKGGLFPDEREREAKTKTTKLQCSAPSGDLEFVYVRARYKNHFSIHETVHSSCKPEEPRLRSRGWVLQEDFLSPRMLHFRKEELSWICSTYSRCECRIRPNMPISHPFRAAQGTVEKTDEYMHSLDIQWPSVVMEYSRRNLTKPSDRIAALSGLANYMEEQTTDTYICGVWYEDLMFQLLWYVDRTNLPEGIPARVPFPYAQSWSWMSIPGPISYYSRHPAGCAPSHGAMSSAGAVEATGLKVLNISRIPLEGNFFGKLLMAHLLLFALVLPVRFDVGTQKWEALGEHGDFDPANLRASIDTNEDLPESNPNASYVFILAGRWVGQGLTIKCMQGVCIIARRMTEDHEPLFAAARTFRSGYGDQAGETIQLFDEFPPQTTNSYQRIGLVRGAGSIDAWKQAKGAPPELVYLF